MPPRGTAKLLHIIDAKLDGARGEMQDLKREVCYITKEMRVNGARGIQDILVEQHRKTNLLNNNLDAIAIVVGDTKAEQERINTENKVLMAATEKLRVRFQMMQSIGKYLDAHPVVKKAASGVLGKLVKIVVWGTVTVMLGALGLGGVWNLIEKVQALLK